MSEVQTPEQRLAGVVGQIIVENAKLGFMAESLQQQVQAANERANELSVQLQMARDQLAAEKDRADRAQIEIAGLSALVRKFEAQIASDVQNAIEVPAEAAA